MHGVPIAGETLDRAVADGLSLRFDRGHGEDAQTTRVAYRRLTAPERQRAEYAGVVASLDVDVLRDGVLVATEPGPIAMLADVENDSGSAVAALPPALETSRAERERWSLRVRGTADGVLQVWEATRRWQGEVTLPVGALLARGKR
ncbi:MAG: hypothetical protein L6Q99_12720 [Planctomycetes bacterium]|nr:hypothetical protein [Planctomycetota bacterium]